MLKGSGMLKGLCFQNRSTHKTKGSGLAKQRAKVCFQRERRESRTKKREIIRESGEMIGGSLQP
uniref:Uncharacterized protein n=1 Tax=Anguilla anguilla TaxID=7936 RepID=A0A0E9T8T3_ANGAN